METPIVLAYARNKTRMSTFDLIEEKDTVLTYIKVTEPRNEYLQKIGAKYVLESWIDNQKILFTGLLPLTKDQYFGDFKNIFTGKRRMIKLEFVNSNKIELTVYRFDLPTNRQRKTHLLTELKNKGLQR